MAVASGLTLVAGTTPDAPAAGKVKIYVDSSAGPSYIDSAGVPHRLRVPVGSVITNPGPLSDPAYLPMDGRYVNLTSYPDLAALTPPPIGPGATNAQVGATVYAVVWTGTLYVTVGNSSTARTSPDGVTWTTRNTMVSATLYGLGQSPSLLVAVGSGGAVTTSPDGITWTARTSGTTQALNSITWSSTLGLFVAVGNSGTILTSPDGITWTARASGTTQTLNAVRWSARLGVFIAVGGGGTILTSPDGITWTARASGTTQTLSCIAESPAAVMAGGSSVACVSSDGITWTARTNAIGFMNSLMYGAGTWIAFVGSSLWTSTDDGTTWGGSYTLPVSASVAYQGMVKDDTVIMPQSNTLLLLPLPKPGYYYIPPMARTLGYLNYYMKVLA